MARYPDVLADALAAAFAVLSLRVLDGQPDIALSVVGDNPLVLTRLDGTGTDTDEWF